MNPAKRSKNRSRQVLFVFCCSVMFTLVLAGCAGGPIGDAKPTPTPVPFVQLPLDIPQKALTAPITGSVPDSQLLHVGITLKIDQGALDQLSKNGIARSGDTTSASELAKKLGISDADYQRLQQFFGVNDATLKLSDTRTSMTLDIKAGNLAQILQTRFVQHQLDQRSFYTPDPQKMPKVPAPVADRILAVTGLDNYSLPPVKGTHLGQQGLVSKQAVGCTPSGMLNWKQVAHAYGYDQLWEQGWHGEHMTINLVEVDGANMNDLRTYFNCVGFKGQLDFTNIDGPAPAAGAETMLDIEMIAGLAPAAHIKDYQIDISKKTREIDVWVNITDALQKILDDNAAHPAPGSVVSISLGQTEDSVTGEVAKAIGQRLQLLTRVEQMTVFVSSGDCGAYDSHIFGKLGVSYPASDPWAVSVGGTHLRTDSQGNRSEERSWTGVPMSPNCSFNEWGTGGGLSKLFKRPDWQKGPGVQNKYSDGHRQLPDIAAVAENVAIINEGKWVSGGGTSAAAPIWAAGMALVNQGLIETKQLFVYGPSTFYLTQAYAGNSKPYYDVTVGTNWYYSATPGWDYTTGFGAPNLPTVYQVIYNNAKL